MKWGYSGACIQDGVDNCRLMKSYPAEEYSKINSHCNDAIRWTVFIKCIVRLHAQRNQTACLVYHSPHEVRLSGCRVL